MSDKLPRDGKVTITLRIPPEVRRWLKVYCAQQELFMDQVVLSLLATLPGCPVDPPVVDSQTATPSGQPASQLRDPELSATTKNGGLPAQRVESIAGNELSAPLQQLATEQLREVTKAFQERLQTSEAHAALERAFNSTPEELGSMLPRNDEALDVDELASLLDH